MANPAKDFPVVPMLLYETPVLDDIKILSLYFENFVRVLTTCF
jgi:hypothetical protein